MFTCSVFPQQSESEMSDDLMDELVLYSTVGALWDIKCGERTLNRDTGVHWLFSATVSAR